MALSVNVALQSPTIAQIIPDGTLSTTVTTADNLNFTIGNGDRAGNNLFHSFDAFSIPTNGSAVFNNAIDIETIFSRVTGRNLSDIDGLIQANGTANLFLLNPNGILFGPNASLDIGGSFLGTTADRILFENNQFFSATDTTTAPLLTVSTPIGVQFGSTQNSITVQGNGHSLAFNEDFEFIRDNRPRGLAVDVRQTLALVGGDIQFEGGNLTAEQGRIELGSVNQSSSVSLDSVTEGLTLGYDEIDSFGTIRLAQASSVDVSGAGSGQIHLQSGTLSLMEDSVILSDVLGTENGGNVLIRASEAIEIAGPEIGDFPSTIFNTGEVGSTGTGGTLSIETDSLRLSGGAQINASTFGKGSGGDVSIEATSIDIVGASRDGEYVSGIFADTYSSAQGRNLVINTDFLRVRDHGTIAVGTFGAGDGGDFLLTANTIELSAGSADFPDISTGLFVDTLDAGTGGNLMIETRALRVTDGASILAGPVSDSTGDGGNIIIRASESIEVSGEAFGYSSAIASDSSSSGDGGDVLLETEQLRVTTGGQISVTSFESGDAGTLTIQADTIDITGLSPSMVFSGLFVSTESSGQGGDLILEADHLRVSEGGIITAATFGSGDGGDIDIQVNMMEISGAAIDFSGTLNGVTSFVAPEAITFDGIVKPPATGTGGDITITANQLLLSNGGQIDASTFGDAAAGRITLNVNELTLTGISDVLADASQIPSRILSSSGTSFAAGSLAITSDRLTLQNGAEINVSSLSSGNAGNLILNTGMLHVEDGGRLRAEVNGGDQGNIRLFTDDLLVLRRNSSITTTASGPSTGGNIEIQSPFIVGIAGENNDIVANAVQGNGGNISITTQGLFGLAFRDRLTSESDITASSEFGLDGTVEINNPEADPSSQVLELPETLVDVSQLVRPGCSLGEDQFVLAGRGGLSSSPMDLMDGDRPWFDLRDLSAFLNNPSDTVVSSPVAQPVTIEPLQESTGMAIAPDGTLQLIASHSHSPIPPHPTCTADPNIF